MRSRKVTHQGVSSWPSFDGVYQRVVSWGSECLSSCGSDSKGEEAIGAVCRGMPKKHKMATLKDRWRFVKLRFPMMRVREGEKCSSGLLRISFLSALIRNCYFSCTATAPMCFSSEKISG